MFSGLSTNEPQIISFVWSIFSYLCNYTKICTYLSIEWSRPLHFGTSSPAGLALTKISLCTSRIAVGGRVGPVQSEDMFSYMGSCQITLQPIVATEEFSSPAHLDNICPPWSSSYACDHLGLALWIVQLNKQKNIVKHFRPTTTTLALRNGN